MTKNKVLVRRRNKEKRGGIACEDESSGSLFGDLLHAHLGSFVVAHFCCSFLACLESLAKI